MVSQRRKIPLIKIAEITQILRSGVIFVGTTFLRYMFSTAVSLRPLREQIVKSYSYLVRRKLKIRANLVALSTILARFNNHESCSLLRNPEIHNNHGLKGTT